MKTISKRFRTLLGGGLILLFSLVIISQVGAQTCVQPPSGMTGWWPGDSNTDDISLSIVGGLDAMLRNNATIGAGTVDNAFHLDGAGAFVEITDDPALDVGADDFTVDLWVNFTSTAGETDRGEVR